MHTVSRSAVPALTTEQMRAVDRAMVEDLHIELVQMMENAGRNLAELAITRFSPTSVTVLAGPGGNGGGGMVAARHLANRDCQVQVVLSEPDRLTPVPAHQADILTRMGITIASRAPTADLVVDALIGYSLRGDPAGTAAQLITWANGQAAPVLALDTPSGLDLTTGMAGSPTVGPPPPSPWPCPRSACSMRQAPGNSTWPTSRYHRWSTSGWASPSHPCSASPACSRSTHGRHPIRLATRHEVRRAGLAGAMNSACAWAFRRCREPRAEAPVSKMTRSRAIRPSCVLVQRPGRLRLSALLGGLIDSSHGPQVGERGFQRGPDSRICGVQPTLENDQPADRWLP